MHNNSGNFIKHSPEGATQTLFFFNNRKSAKPSTLGMYYGGTNQETKVQQSRKIGKEEQEK